MKLDFDCIKEILYMADAHRDGAAPEHVVLNLTKPFDQKLAHHYKYLIEENLLDVEIQPLQEVEHDHNICEMIIGTGRSLQLELIVGGVTAKGDRMLRSLSAEAR